VEGLFARLPARVDAHADVRTCLTLRPGLRRSFLPAKWQAPHRCGTRLPERGIEFADGSLPSTKHHEHVQVECEERLVFGRSRHGPLRHDHVRNEQASWLTADGAPAACEDGECILISPVVQDPPQQVDVAARRDRLEEVAGHRVNAVRHPAAAR
jgi:hypothetical protein